MNADAAGGRDASVPSWPDCAQTATRRERKKLATHDALREAAYRLVAERGFHSVTVEDLADAADVSTRTFFNYFPSKEAALLGAAADWRFEVVAQLEARPATEGPIQALSAVLLAQAHAMEQRADARGESREHRLARMSVILSEPALIAAYVEEFTASERLAAQLLTERLGLEPDDPYPAILAAISFAAARAAMTHWAESGGSASLTELTRRALDTVARSNDSGQARGATPPCSPASASRHGAAAASRAAR